MKHLNHRFLPRILSGLFLSGLIAACTVGDTSGVAQEPNAADAGPGGGEADGDVATALQWSPETEDVAGLKPEMHFVSPTEIYAVINNKICMWNGTAWVDHTADAIGIASAIHFVSPTEIYAVVGNRIDMWTGTLGADGVWNLNMTPNINGINTAGSAEIHVLGAEDMYAVIDLNNGIDLPYIAHYDGVAWAEHTLPVEGLQRAISFISPTEIYAVIGLKICMWDGLAWVDLTPDTPDLKPALHAVSNLLIHANIGEKVCTWDGTAWTDITADMPGMHPVFHYISDEDIRALAGLSVSHWAPVAL